MMDSIKMVTALPNFEAVGMYNVDWHLVAPRS